MATIPENENTTLTAIDLAVTRSQDKGHRAHLGASLIGDSCRRKLWYTFHWCENANFTGRILRLFQRGHNEEDIFIKLLKMANVEVSTVDPSTGQQYTFSACNGHFGGSIDAALKGLIEAVKTWHIGEFKTHNDKSFKDLTKKGVLKSKPTHYAQMQVYMGLSGMKRAYYMAVNKNDDSLYSERIKFDEDFYNELIEKAQAVIDAPEPLERINEKLDWYECNFCNYKNICKFNAVPPANCRTCMHSTPVDNGRWHCDAYDTFLSKSQQESGCKTHLFNPVLIPYATEVVSFDESKPPQWVEYKKDDIYFYNTVENGKVAANVYTSVELHSLNHTLIGDDTLGIIKTTFNATIGSLDDAK